MRKFVKSAVFEAEKPLEMGLNLQKFQNNNNLNNDNNNNNKTV